MKYVIHFANPTDKYSQNFGKGLHKSNFNIENSEPCVTDFVSDYKAPILEKENLN